MDELPILFLRGCHLDDCKDVEDLMEARLEEAAAQWNEHDDFNGFKYDKIPHKFTSLDTWPLSTNLKCWECDDQVRGRPYAIATYIAKGGGFPNVESLYGDIDTDGNFCDECCAYTYIGHGKKYAKNKGEYVRMTRILACRIGGLNEVIFFEAPSKTCMKEYGGNKTRQEYRNEKAATRDALLRGILKSPPPP
jgi:hypothetical protein